MVITKEMIQNIIDDDTLSWEEKLKIFSEKKTNEGVGLRIDNKNIEILKELNEKIFRKFYKNRSEIQKINFSDSDWLRKKIEENFVLENGKLEILMGKKLDINDKIKNIYKVNFEKDLAGEIGKTKELIELLKTYKNFFVNTNEKIIVYNKLLGIYQLLRNKSYIDFIEIKDKVENL